MLKGRCWTEYDDKGTVRIFRSYSTAISEQFSRSISVREYSRKDAVGEIRKRVFERSGGHCEDCDKLLTWAFHMHESVPKGRGGEVSLENCLALCADCHLNFEHRSRRLRFGE